MIYKDELSITIAVVGLGYVGLPLALEFGKIYRTLGYDVSQEKVASYLSGIDPAGEMEPSQFSESRYFEPTSDASSMRDADFIIIAVPTPVDGANNPDFSALKSASRVVGENMKRSAIVIYESTVYPGATEELCVPILELASGYSWRRDFSVGYSPERINPGDKLHTLTNIIKVVSGDSEATLNRISALYNTIIQAGTFEAASIKTAEAAKVIENTQRDLNIALMNELALIFNRLDIDTSEVLEAAGTKWNFLPFRPGLVGGHCIGVDPYYLTYKAAEVGYHPEVILAGRRINDGVAQFISQETIKCMINLDLPIKNANVIVMGLTFKEDCSDVRNSKVADLVKFLATYGLNVFIYDPVASVIDAERAYGIHLTEWDDLPVSSAIIAAVEHTQILDLGMDKIADKLTQSGLYVDVKSKADKTKLESLGYHVWRL
tara:strand:+ start:5590 stop:6891 length:1302 start_codon:yes stop_codon:yes gene_type:complete